ncbi:MAG: ribosome maturation factor RimP [Leptolyngbyaceae cyanobacterium bins.59]|nr:ribosome maturation factor RimP [Leptolyngbyaceae cyanobacterium bins.59]
MVHPLIPPITEIATPVATSLGLELVNLVFHTHQSPPVLRVDIRNPQQDTSLDDCERMSRALEAALDKTELIPDRYMLEVSSPGVPRSLTTDREFTSFRGFPVIVKTNPDQERPRELRGKLIRRDDTLVYLNQKGRTVKIPREQIEQVQLDEQSSE